MCKITGSALEPPSTTSYVAQFKTAREVVRESVESAGTVRLDELTEQLQFDELTVRRELAELERDQQIDRFVVGNKIMLREADT
jgi:DeoR/GlpR family transcriptional regulator of sugar metabolism